MIIELLSFTVKTCILYRIFHDTLGIFILTLVWIFQVFRFSKLVCTRYWNKVLEVNFLIV